MKAKVSWTPTEARLVATELVNLRLLHPFEPNLKLLNKAMHKMLTEHRWRSLATITQVPEVVKIFNELWMERVTAPASTPPEPVLPIIVHVEVPQPIDYSKLYEQLDGPTLAAFAVGKLERMFAQMSVTRHEQPATMQPTAIPLSIIAAATPKVRKPRVAVLTLASQFEDIRQKVNGLSEKLDIRYLDSERSTNDGQIARVDYAVVFSATGHHNWNKAKEYLPSDHVFFVEGISRGVQKLYDIAAMQ